MKKVIAILVSGLFASAAFAAAPAAEKALTIPEKAEMAAPAEAGKIESADALKAAPVEADKAAPAEAGKVVPVEGLKAVPADAGKTGSGDALKAAPAEAGKLLPSKDAVVGK